MRAVFHYTKHQGNKAWSVNFT